MNLDIPASQIELVVFGGLFTGLITWLLATRNAHKLVTSQRDARITALEARLDTVTQAVVPWTAAVQQLLVKQLTHTHTPRMDELLRKLGPPNTQTFDERLEFAQGLKERMLDMAPKIDARERNAAEMLPLIVERHALDIQALETGGQLKVVLMPEYPVEHHDARENDGG